MMVRTVTVAAVAVLGVIASLNFMDQSTVRKITSHPIYQSWLGDSPSDAGAPNLGKQSVVAKKAVAPNATAQKGKASKAKSQSQMSAKEWFAKAKAKAKQLKNKAVALVRDVDVGDLGGKLESGSQKALAKTKVMASKAKRFLKAQYRKLTGAKKDKKPATAASSQETTPPANKSADEVSTAANR